MASKEPETEATLGEVLAEVSVTDVGRMLKSGSATFGCLAVYLLAMFAIIAVTDATGYGLENWGIPDWLAWLLMAWFLVYITTYHTSYHEWKMSWYFPKLNWLSSLVLAAYFVGFGYLLGWVNDIELEMERTAAFFLVYFGYTSPFLLFLSAISVGHANLMEKRRTAAGAPQGSSGGAEC